MTQSMIDDLAARAVRGVKTISNKDIDIAIAYAFIDDFMTAYKTHTRVKYRGSIELGDLLRALNAYCIAVNRFGEDSAEVYNLMHSGDKFFYRKNSIDAYAATFAEYVSQVVNTAYTKMFGI